MTNSLPPKRRRFQYTIRSLLVLTTLVAIACSWYANEMQNADRRRTAIEKIIELGGEASYHDADESNGAGQPSKWYSLLRHIHGDERLGNAVAIRLTNAEITDAELESLADVPTLESLAISSAQITDDLTHLRGLRSLEVNCLGGVPVTDTGLAHLKGLTKLESLWIVNLLGPHTFFMPGEGVGFVTGSGHFKLAEKHIADAGLTQLKGLTKLETLIIIGYPTEITDAGMADLAGLSNLKFLNLDTTQVTDTGLMRLRGLAKLRYLDFNSPHITSKGLENLLDALPNCRLPDQ